MITMSSYTFIVLWWCISSILHQTYTTPMCLSVTRFNSRWCLCAVLHPISQKFPHCWMVSVRCAPPHQSEVSPLLDGICAVRSTPSVRSFPIVGWYLCSALHPISQKFPHCWMVSVRCAPPHQSEVFTLLDGICALCSTPSVRSFHIVGWYLCTVLHPISQKFPHCWMVSVRCAPPHQSEVSPLLDGICALCSTPSVRSFPIVGWYLCTVLHPISQKFPHCWMVSVYCAPPHQSEVSPLLDGICALCSTPSVRSFPIVGWYLCTALHPISQKFPHCWMVSVRCAPPHQSEVSPLLDGICALCSTPSVRSFPIVVFETVLMFVSLMMALSCPFKEDCLALPLSTPLTDSVYIWLSWFRRVNRNSTVTYFVTITCAGYFSYQIGWWIVIAVTIKMMTITKCVTDYCMKFAYREQCVERPHSLPKFLSAIKWNDRESVAQVRQCCCFLVCFLFLCEVIPPFPPSPWVKCVVVIPPLPSLSPGEMCCSYTPTSIPLPRWNVL